MLEPVTPGGQRIEVIKSYAFEDWLQNLRDSQAVAKINTRIRRVSLGNLGDVRPVGDGVSEMRIHFGPGYRLYFISQGRQVVILLCGGDKGSQRGDIERAKQVAAEWRNSDGREIQPMGRG